MSFGTDRGMEAMTDVNTRWRRWRPRVIKWQQYPSASISAGYISMPNLWHSFQEICQQMRRNLKMWWTNERTDNNTHKPHWQPRISPKWFGHSTQTQTHVQLDERMKWQQYHQHQSRLMIRYLDASACQISCHFPKWFVSETAQLNRCYKIVEIKRSMSYPCLMIQIMSSSIRFELKRIIGLPANAPRPERVTNRQTGRRMY